MQYGLLIYENDAYFEHREHPEDEEVWQAWRSYHAALREAGILVGGEPLERADTTATTIRVRGGERRGQDGPSAARKERLGGFIVLELPSLDAAVEWAARCPAAAYGAVEVRPIADLKRLF